MFFKRFCRTFFGRDILGDDYRSRLNPTIFQCYYLHLKMVKDTLKKWVNTLPYSKTAVLLDIGSGQNPPYHSLFKDKVGRIISCDPFAPAEIQSRAENIPLPDGSVDYVISTAVLEHVKNPFLVAAEIKRLLKSDGQAFISTHGVWPLHKAPVDCWRFLPDGFRELFKDFRKITIIPHGGTVLCLFQLANLCLAKSLYILPIMKLPLMVCWTINNLIALGLDKLAYNDRLVISYSIILIK